MTKYLRAAALAVAMPVGALTQLGAHFGTHLSAQQPPPRRDESGPATAGSGPAARPLAFEGVTVVDVRTGQLQPAQTVLIVGRHIRAVGPARRLRLPAGTQRVAARGRYLIPGLWDMHVHVWETPELFYPLFLANGVTGVREMSRPSSLEALHAWRRAVAAGQRVGPRVVGTGAALEGVRGRIASNAIQAFTAADGRRLVDSLRAAGADFIKVYEHLSPHVYFAIVAEARRLGIPVVGHLPEGVTLEEASDSGQRSIEHLTVGTGADICGEADSLRIPGALPSRLSEPRCAALAARFARNGTWLVPTRVVAYVAAAPDADPIAARLRSWPARLRGKRKPSQRFSQAMHGTERRFEYSQQTMRLLTRVGMPLLAGTDFLSEASGIAPGFALHDELAVLVAEGMTPLGALQAATLNPATFFQATDSLGSVAPGQLADLVLLEANPLADIGNTQKIWAVVANGRHFDRAALDTLLANVARLGDRR